MRCLKKKKKTELFTVIGSIRLLCWLSWDDSRSTWVERRRQGQQALSSFLLKSQGQIFLQQGQFQLSFWGEKYTCDAFMLLNTSCNVSSSLYTTVPDLGTLHLKHFSLLLKFCTPHCYGKKKRDQLLEEELLWLLHSIHATRRMQKYLVTEPVLISARFRVTVVHRNSLAQNH